MANAAAEDDYCGIVERGLAPNEIIELETIDNTAPDIPWLEQYALECEQAALDVKGISNIAGCGASWNFSNVVYGSSNGFIGNYGETNWGIGISALAQKGDEMERDYDHDCARFRNQLKNAKIIGKQAGERTINRLGAKKIPSQRRILCLNTGLPIVFCIS